MCNRTQDIFKSRAMILSHDLGLPVSTWSTGEVLQPVVSFTVHYFIHFDLP